MAAVQEEDRLSAAEAGLAAAPAAATASAQQKASIREALQSPNSPVDPDDIIITVKPFAPAEFCMWP